MFWDILRVRSVKRLLDAPSDDLDYDRIAEQTEGLVDSNRERIDENAAWNVLKQPKIRMSYSPISQHDVEKAIRKAVKSEYQQTHASEPLDLQ